MPKLQGYMITSIIEKTKRNLPHWTANGSIYWITFRLADSIPQSKLNQWKSEREQWLQLHPQPWDSGTLAEYQHNFGDRLEMWLDRGYGSCSLRNPECRELVRQSIMKCHGTRHQLHHGVIMPNHVHLLLEPFEGESLAKLLQGMKGGSSFKCNQISGKTGRFWMQESYDHIVRDRDEYAHFVRYIRSNPLKAKLRLGEYWLM